MATFINLINYTEQGIKNIKDSPDRAAATKKLAQSLGGDITQIHLTMGAYDLVVMSEFPDAATAAKFALTVGAQGNVRTTTLQAFSASEMAEIIGSLP